MSEDIPAPGAGGLEQEGAASEPTAATRDPADEHAELEELVLPAVEATGLEPVQEGASLSDGTREYRVAAFIGTRAGVNQYRALWGDDGSRAALVEEASTPEPFEHRQRLLGGIEYPMLPRLLGSFTSEGRIYLATEWVEGETLEQALQRGVSLEDVVGILVQVTQALKKLHGAGWLHLAITPGAVVLGRPIKLANFEWSAPKGTRPREAVMLGGYSSPELLQGVELDERADIFSVGALLYRAVTGTNLPEAGPQMLDLWEQVKVPGVPQILARCLGHRDGRFGTVEELLRTLVELKRALTPRPTGYEIVARTTIGLEPTRTANEDSYSYLNRSVASEGQAEPVVMLCVADGMGGMEAGEIASRAAAQSALREMHKRLDEVPGMDPAEQANFTDALVRAANEAVCQACEGKDAGTTLSCAVVAGGRLTVGHVGDSRIYLIRHDEIRQLTEDHTLVAIMVKSGQITAEEARGHPDSNKVLRSLGSVRVLPDYYVYTLERSSGHPTLDLEPGDLLLLCSDGVWGQVTDVEMLEATTSTRDLVYASNMILQKVLERRAPDNATILLARAH